jgi:transcription factor MAFF/G/K
MEPPPAVVMHSSCSQQQHHHLQSEMTHNNFQSHTVKQDLYLMGSEGDYTSSPSVSPVSKSSSITSPTIPGRSLPELSDEELAQLSVRQLNMKLQGHDRQTVSALKQKRRTLKNRGYALNCRVRRIQNQVQLEADNVMLRDQVRYLTEALHQIQARLHYYEPHTFSSLPLTSPPPPTTMQTTIGSPRDSSPSSSYSYSIPHGFISQ